MANVVVDNSVDMRGFILGVNFGVQNLYIAEE